jgi:hypothetical protein
MIIEGRVTKVEVKTGISENTGNPWKRVEFVVEYKEFPTDRFYDHIKLESFHESVVDNIKEGMMVKAIVSHKTHEYNGNTYNDIILNEVHCVKKQAQAVEGQYAAAAANMAEQHDQTAAKANVPAEQEAEDPDDLPF